jgi:hypothetical protein
MRTISITAAALARQVSAVLNRLNGQAYSSTLSALNDLEAALAKEAHDTALLSECQQFIADAGCDEDDNEVTEHRADLLDRIDRATAPGAGTLSRDNLTTKGE